MEGYQSNEKVRKYSEQDEKHNVCLEFHAALLCTQSYDFFPHNQKVTFFQLAQWFGASGPYLCNKLKDRAMFEIILSVSLYAGAVALLVKCAIAYCENSHDHIVTEP